MDLKTKKVLDKHHLFQLNTLIISKYTDNMQLDSALAYAQKCSEMAGKEGDSLYEARYYKLIGNTYFHLNLGDKAINYWKRCIEKAKHQNDFLLLEQCHHNIGSVILISRGAPHAEPYFLKAIEYGHKVQGDNSSNLNQNYRLLASTYEVSGRLQQADSLFRTIIENYRLKKDTLAWLEASMFYSKVLVKNKQAEKGLKLSEDIIALTRTLKNFKVHSTALYIYALNLHETGYDKKAFGVMEEMIGIETRNNADILKSEIAKAEAAFKVRELAREKEQAILAEQNRRRLYMVGLFILLLLVTGIVVFYYQKKQNSLKQTQEIEKVKLIFEAEEKERTRIAQDLHDNMGAYATSILARIDMLEFNRTPIESERIKDLRHDAENIMSTLRETIWILKTKTITISGFLNLIKSYTYKQLKTNLNINVLYEEDIQTERILTPAISLNLFRIVQEIIQNIIKHSAASQVNIQLRSTDTLSISIYDNGSGFDVTDAIRGSGLNNLQHRASDIHFTFSISSQPGKGTSIQLEGKV
ncbi:MAG: ATP-binding protein [Sediminibacterium sp.]|nr:ATP-binding protein [Sediminibacterium sp.]